MGALGELFLPALGGYWLLTHSNRWKHLARRQSGYHVFFRAAFAGVGLYMVSWLILQGWSTIQSWPNSEVVKQPLVIPGLPLSPATLISVGLALVAPSVLNRFYSEGEGAVDAAKKNGDLLEVLVQRAQEDDRLIEVSLQSGKIYVGWPAQSGINRYGAEEADIVLTPLASGYRDNQTRDLILTAQYATLIDEEPGAVDDVAIVVPMTEVRAARMFDLSLYSPPKDTDPPRTITRRTTLEPADLR